ncbi:hypothetical protein K501DRAFT_314713 [Backusella circina FSU 941]|nr:hypothetical protein K501DRAFT_314713 [Backusella circina FSU 941]
MSDAKSRQRRKKLKILDKDEEFIADSDDEGEKCYDSDIDDIDFNDEFQDDDEGMIESEQEDEETKDAKERIRKEIKGSSFEMGASLSSQGKEEEFASNTVEDDDQKDGSENKDRKETKKEVPVPSMKKSHTTKLKTVSKPTVHSKYSSQHEEVSAPLSFSSTTSSSPLSTPQREIVMKQMNRSVSGLSEKYQKSRDTSSPLGAIPTPYPSPETARESLITEEEIINALRGKQMTTKEFVMLFKKRIKYDK